jgi:Ca2+:H+ antiporter
MIERLVKERMLLSLVVAALVAYALEHTLTSSGRLVATLATTAIIAAIVAAAVRVAHHAEVLAEKLGDPYGSMVLTLSAVLVEVIILLIVMRHTSDPTMAKSTIFAAIQIDVNLLLGLAAIIGGLKHGEQIFNADSGRVYTVMIMVAVGFSMVLPNFIPHANWKVLSVITIVVMVLMYGMFLRLQTKEHSYFFWFNYTKHFEKLRRAQAKEDRKLVSSMENEDYSDEPEEEFEDENAKFSAFMLVLGVVITGFLAEVMSLTLNLSIEGMGFPPIFMAILVAGISASPEIITALKAALQQRYQIAINIGLGAALSTVILTIPVIEFMALMTGQDIDMGLTTGESVLMLLTVLAAWMGVSDGESNAIEGLGHFVLFIAFLTLGFLS